MTTYIYQLADWPQFHWDVNTLTKQLTEVRHIQGRLIGKMESLGFPLRTEAILQTLTMDVLKSCEIEGENLDKNQVRSSIARKLGIDIAGMTPSDRNVDGVVEMMLDATQHCQDPLTKERLLGWHAALFPSAYSGMRRIKVAAWRDGPMQVVSGPIGREWTHFEAPAADRLDNEMTKFLDWFNRQDKLDLVLKAFVAHIWFITIHPFEDGNGRIARTITDLLLARSEKSSQRFYSMSAQIRTERNAYYDMLKDTQKGTLDITEALKWFLGCLHRAFDGVANMLAQVLRKAELWEKHSAVSLNERQHKMINLLIDKIEGKLTSSKWAKMSKCSQDTASRDINDLIAKGILEKEAGGGRSTSYRLVEPT